MGLVSGLLAFALIAAVAGIAISAITWAFGSHNPNPHIARLDQRELCTR
jgi:hypothetical protein